jgi:hypothetical protein
MNVVKSGHNAYTTQLALATSDHTRQLAYRGAYTIGRGAGSFVSHREQPANPDRSSRSSPTYSSRRRGARNLAPSGIPVREQVQRERRVPRIAPAPWHIPACGRMSEPPLRPAGHPKELSSASAVPSKCRRERRTPPDEPRNAGGWRPQHTRPALRTFRRTGPATGCCRPAIATRRDRRLAPPAARLTVPRHRICRGTAASHAPVACPLSPRRTPGSRAHRCTHNWVSFARRWACRLTQR